MLREGGLCVGNVVHWVILEIRVLKNEIDTKDIGDELDAEKKQDDADCEDEGNKIGPLYQHLDLII